MRSMAPAAALLAALLLAPPAPAAPAEAVEGEAELRATARQQGKRKVRAIARLARREGAAAAAAAELALRGRMAGAGVARLERLADLPFVALELDERQLDALVASGLVDGVERDEILRPSLAQSVPLVGAPAAWRARDGGSRGEGQVVAILDSGVDGSHPMLRGKVLAEACFSSVAPGEPTAGFCGGAAASRVGRGAGGPCPARATDECRHGTHIAGTAVGGDAGGGGPGVAPGAKIVAVQVFHDYAGIAIEANESDVIRGLNHVRSLLGRYRVAAVNLSLSAGRYAGACDRGKRAFKAAVDALRARGVPTVVAAGNGHDPGSVGFPGCISSAITVAASTDLAPERVAPFSSMSPLVDLVAPGVSITSAVPGGGYARLSGTSMAAPHVAGAWAVLKAAGPGPTVARIEQALEATGLPVRDPRSGLAKPRIDVAGALAALRGR